MLNKSPFALVGARLKVVALCIGCILIAVMFWGLPLNSGLTLSMTINPETAGHVQVFYLRGAGFSEKDSVRAEVFPGGQTLNFAIPAGTSVVRLDPSEAAITVILRDVSLSSRWDKAPIALEHLAQGQHSPHVTALKIEEGGLVIASNGNDASVAFTLPQVETAMPTWLRLAGTAASVLTLLALYRHGAALCRRARTALPDSVVWLVLMNDGRAMQVLAFAVTTLSFYIYASRYVQPPYFCCDARHYWELSELFAKGGVFSFANFDNALRGYLLPFLLHGVRQVAILLHINEFQFFYFVNGAVHAAILSLLLPWLVQRLWGMSVELWKVILFNALFFVFWRGYLINPLSDTWSLSLIFLSIAAMMVGLSARGWLRWGMFLASGFAMGMALNIRPIYQVSPVMAVLAIMVAPSLRLHFKGLAVALIVAGTAIPLIPQSMINQANFGTTSPFVQTNRIYGGADLFVAQLFFGTVTQRHECAFFVDPMGDLLLKEQGIETVRAYDKDSIELRLLRGGTYGQYFQAVLNNPLEYTAIYWRHVLNGIAVFNSNIYDCNLVDRLPLMYGSMALWFAGIVVLAAVRNTLLRHWHSSLVMVLGLAPAFLTIPTGMEGRYFLGFHMLMYMTVTLMANPAQIMAFVRPRIGLLLGLLIACFVVYTAHIDQLFAAAYSPIAPVSSDWYHLLRTPIAY